MAVAGSKETDIVTCFSAVLVFCLLTFCPNTIHPSLILTLWLQAGSDFLRFMVLRIGSREI